MSREVFLKIAKPIFLIAPILILMFAVGCSKSLLQSDYAEPFLFDTAGKTCFGDCNNIPLPGDGGNSRLPYHPTAHFGDIYFAVDKYDLNSKIKTILEKYATYLKAHPESGIQIQGHSDARGSNRYNLSLGERRTQTIKSYLILLGVDKNRIQTISFGEEKPFCVENNEACWYQNRRAHFMIAE